MAPGRSGGMVGVVEADESGMLIRVKNLKGI